MFSPLLLLVISFSEPCHIIIFYCSFFFIVLFFFFFFLFFSNILLKILMLLLLLILFSIVSFISCHVSATLLFYDSANRLDCNMTINYIYSPSSKRQSKNVRSYFSKEITMNYISPSFATIITSDARQNKRWVT